MFRPRVERLAALLLAGSCALAVAQSPEPPAAAPNAERGAGSSSSALDALRPSGPVTVKADHAEWVQDSVMKYSGKVSLDSDTLTLRGDTMDVHQLPDGHFEATITGKPGTLDHRPQPGTVGIASQPVHADAGRLQYDSRTDTVTLIGDARLRRGNDEVHGDTIGYAVGERRVRAHGGDSGQVTITFTPPAKNGSEAAPAPAGNLPPTEIAPTPAPASAPASAPAPTPEAPAAGSAP